MIRFACDSCGAKFKVDDSKAGKAGRCPQCGRGISIPYPEDDRFDDLASLADAAAISPAAPAVASPVPAGGSTCPGCDQPLSADAPICAHCGIKLPSGRPVMTAYEPDLNDIYMRAEAIVPWLSFILWSGIHPISSEADRTRRPLATYAILLVTIAVSVMFFAANVDSEGQVMGNLMLWDNDAMTAEQATESVLDERDATGPDGMPLSEEQIHALAILAEMDDQAQDQAYTFQPYQLITHAFLHAGPMHLAGNMLFLLVFGARVNSLVGNVQMLILYLALAAAGGWAHMASVSGGLAPPVLGASGAVMGMCGMYLILFPLQKVHIIAWLRLGIFYGFRLMQHIFTLPGIVVVGVYIAIDLFFVASRIDSGTAHWAHIGGFIAGAILAVVLLAARLVPHGANLLSIALGKYAWPIIGRPRCAS